MTIQLSFVVPSRNRETMHAGLEYNLQSIFGQYNYELIYVLQTDSKLFKKGQLCNLGFLAARSNVIIFQDVDVRHLQAFDPFALLSAFNRPFVAFDKVAQLNEPQPGHFDIIETHDRPFGWGACSVFTREQFQNSGGFSNLILGWGAEDNIMNDRAAFRRYAQTIGHVYHPPARFSVDVHQSQWYKNNSFFWQTEKTRDKHKDGYLQTIANTTFQHSAQLSILEAANITVKKNFAYPELYRRAIQAETTQC